MVEVSSYLLLLAIMQHQDKEPVLTSDLLDGDDKTVSS